MNNNKQMPPPDWSNDDEINLIDLLLVLLKRKWMIFSVVFLAILISVTISLMLPWYIRTITLFLRMETSYALSDVARYMRKMNCSTCLLMPHAP